MNNMVRISQESQNAQEFAQKYLSYLTEVIASLDTQAISDFVGQIEAAREEDKTVFIAGNGGSAACASHMANDLGLDVLKKTGIDRPFRLHALTDSVPVMTAIGNDDGYDNLFTMQLKIHHRPGDKLIVISASGNSPNVVNAAKYVKEHGGTVLGLLGFDGGALKDLCDVAILANTPKKEYGPVEDVHMIMDHLMSNYLLGKYMK